MKAKPRTEVAILVVLSTLCAADQRDAHETRGVPAPPPHWGYVPLRQPMRCPEPVCPEPVCPQPVCPTPVCPQPACPPAHCSPCPDVSCPQPVCPRPSCPSTQACPATGPSCSSCPWKVLATYDHFQGFGFYKAYKTKVNWHQAKALCAADGGHLGIINSEKEAELFKLLYRKNELTDWVFLGFHDLNEENNFETVMGEPLSKTGYMKWRRGQPDNAGNEDCGTIDQNAFFNDVKCDWKSGFICEVHEKNALGQ